MWSVPNSPVCSATGQPPAGSMNCGNSEKYSSNALGFRPLIPAPLSMICPREEDMGSVDAPSAAGRRQTPQPSHIR